MDEIYWTAKFEKNIQAFIKVEVHFAKELSSSTKMFDRLRRHRATLTSSKTMSKILQNPANQAGTIGFGMFVGIVGFIAWDLGPPGTFANILLFSRIYPSPKKNRRSY